MRAARALGIEDALRDVALLRLGEAPARLEGQTALWGLHRQRLHTVLLEAARSAGVELVTGSTATDVRPGAPGGEPATLRWRTGAAEHEAHAAWWSVPTGPQRAPEGPFDGVHGPLRQQH
jgi:flavin-dependent dehydrogenase